MSKSLTIRKGDKVRVISGKDKGKEGKVLKSYPAKERVSVEGVALMKKHVRPSQRNPQGGIMTMPGTIHVSNVMLICPNCSQPSKVSHKREGGVLVRVCKKCERPVEK